MGNYKMDLIWGIEQMERELSQAHSPASNIMNICSEVLKQVNSLKLMSGKDDIEDINLHGMTFDDAGLNMKMSGKSVKMFYMFLINLFYSSGGTNFLTLAVEHEKDKFEITIKNCNGKLTPVEQIENLTKERDELKSLLSARPQR